MKKILVILFLVFFSLIVLILSRLIIIKKIDCVGKTLPCSGSLVLDLEAAINHPVFTSLKRAKEILTKNGKVVSFMVRFQLPDVLVVKVIEKKPEVALAWFDQDGFLLTSSDGSILAHSTETSLPIIYVRDPLVSDEELVFAINEFKYLSKTYLMTTAYLQNSGLELYFGQLDLRAILPLRGDLDVVLGTVTYVISQLNTDSQISKIESSWGGKPKIVDFRYKNPVVKL